MMKNTVLKDKFVGLVRTRELAEEIYDPFGYSITEICFDGDVE